MDEALLDRLIGQLLADPLPLSEAESIAAIPHAPGCYAVWAPHSLSPPGLEPVSHPTRPDLVLLYLGIAPDRATSSSNLHIRVVDRHLKGSTANSTLRYTLASLLREALQLRCRLTPAGKVVLEADSNRRLSAYMRQLSITSCTVRQPWDFEAALIQKLSPPLNLSQNRSHPCHGRIKAAREALRIAAARGGRSGLPWNSWAGRAALVPGE